MELEDKDEKEEEEGVRLLGTCKWAGVRSLPCSQSFRDETFWNGNAGGPCHIQLQCLRGVQLRAT